MQENSEKVEKMLAKETRVAQSSKTMKLLALSAGDMAVLFQTFQEKFSNLFVVSQRTLLTTYFQGVYTDAAVFRQWIDTYTVGLVDICQ